MPQRTPTTPFVEPDEPSPSSIVHAAERTLASAGCPESDARWLAALLVQVLPRGDSDDSNQGAADDGPLGSVSMVWPYTKLAYVGFSSAGVDLEALAQVSDSTYRDSGLLATLAALMGELYAPRIEVPDRAPDDETWAWSIGEHEAVKVAQAMLARGADFRTLLMQGWPPILVKELLGSPIDSKREREKRVCRVLVLAGAIEQGLADTLTAPYPQSVLQAVSDEQEARAAPQPAPHRADAKPLDEEAIARAASNLLTGSFDYYLSCYREPEHREIARRIVQGTLDDLREMTALAAQAGDTQFASIVGVIADAASARWANSEHGRLFDIYAGHAPMWQEHMLAFARDMRPYFELAEVVHCATRKSDASPRRFAAQFRSPDFVLVVWVLGLSRTHHGIHVHRLCRAHGVPWVDSWRIPNPALLLDQIGRLGIVGALQRRRLEVAAST